MYRKTREVSEAENLIQRTFHLLLPNDRQKSWVVGWAELLC